VPTILIAEDSGFTRRLLGKGLRDAGYSVLEAEDGAKALEVFKSQRPDCVITDLLMPVMGGVELLQKVRQVDPIVPVIVLTADVQESSFARCRELGIQGFLNKPARPEELLPCVRAALDPSPGVPS
jgi:CheY-like chemotaxis protein